MLRALKVGSVVIGVALVLSLLIRKVPTKDAQSDLSDAACHDLRQLFPEGSSLARALFGTGILAGQDDWPAVVGLLKDLAERRGLEFRNASISRPGVETLQISACASGQPVVLVNEIEWDFGDNKDLRTRPRGEPIIDFAIYGDVPGDIWQPVATDLVAMLDARWPGGVRFRDEEGRLTSDRPSFLDSEL